MSPRSLWILRRLAACLIGLIAAVPASAQDDAAPAYRGLGAASVAPEVLARFRPPPLPADISRRIQRLLDLRPPGLGVPSPDGRRLYFGWRVTGVDQVWRLDGPERFPQQLTAGEERTEVAAVSPDGRWLALQRDRQGEENPGFYLQSAEGGPLREVQHKAGVQTAFQHFSPDGRHAYYVANDVRRDSYAVYRHDIAAARSERLHDGQGFWRVADVAPGRLLLVKATGSRGREWWLFDEASARLTPLLGQGEYADYLMRFGAQADRYIVATSKPSGFTRVYQWRPGEALAPVDVPGGERWDIENVMLDPARRRLYLTINEAGYRRVQVLDATSFAPLPLPWPAGLDHQVVGAASADGEHVVLGLAAPDRPRETALWNWRDRTLVRWTLPSTPEAETRQFAAASLESYPARDGTPIPMFVRRSARCADAAAPPCPVIVHFHGGPESQARPGFSAIWQLFVDAGFVIVEPNVRGSSGYGRAWLDADNGARRLQVIGDIEDAARHLRRVGTRNGATPRIGVYGGSYGGYAALMAMTRFAGAYDAGVSNVGIANLLSFLENTAPYRRALRVTEYGDPVADREALIQLSPTTWVEQLKAPLMIVQGANDPRVPVGEALQMHEVARQRGVPLELMIFADEGHGASSRANQALQWGHVLRFFQQHLR